jgi:hypothetical protein
VTLGAGAGGFIDRDDATSHAPSTYAASTADFYADQDDPYAVPPLPHMNPGLGGLYRDDPNAPRTADPCRRCSTRRAWRAAGGPGRRGDRDNADGMREPRAGDDVRGG